MQDWRVYYNGNKRLRAWLKLAHANNLEIYAHIQQWLLSTYNAQVVDDKPNEWYIQFPDQESFMQFVLTWE